MTDKYIFYEFDGERYKVPVSEQKEFEKQAPTAKIMLTYDKENYKVPLGELGGFLQETGVDKVTYSAFDDKKQYSPNMSTERYVSFDEPAVPKVASETQPSYAEPDKFDWSATSAEMPMSNREQRRARRNMESYLRRAENEEYANAVIDSHNENKKAAEEYIERIDKEFSAYESEEPEKTFWQKLSESMRQAKAEQRLGASAFNAEQKKSDIKKGQNYVDAKIAKNIESKVEDKIKEYNDPAKTFVGGVAHGLRDTVFDIDTWDSTVGAEEAARIYSITKKLDNGEKLTEGEQLIVDALVDDLSSDIYLASEFGRGYKAGKVTGESLPFMLETAINPASGFGKSFTKKFGKEIFKRVSQKLGSKVARAAVHGTRVATDIAGAAMMSATTSQARVAEDALNRLSGQVDFSMADDGTLQFNGFTGGEDSAFKAYAKAFGANTIEHFSEMVGNYFAPIGEATKSGAIALANKVGLKRVGQLLDEMTPNGFGALINDFAEQTQWQGVFGEFAEEMVSGALNALVVGDQSLKKYDKHGNLNENYLFDKENMIDTFLGVAILGGTISAAKTLGYTTPETRYNREISRAKKNLRGILSEEEMAQLEAFAANPFGMGAANLTPFFDDNRDDDFKRAVGSYLKAVMEKKGYEISRGANLSGTQQGMNEMRNAFHLGQNMSEADLYDINEAEASAIQALRDTGIFDTMEGAAVPFLTEDALELGSYDLFAMSNDNRYTDEEKEAFRNLAIVRNAKEGLEGMLNARTQAVVDASNRIATDASQDGKLTIGIHNGQIVFIKGGVQVNNGSIVNPNASGGYPVEVVNSMTGEVSLVESSQIENVVTDDVEAYNTRMGGIISEYYQQRQDKWRNTKSAKSKLAEVEGMVGQSVYIDNGNGNNMTEVEIMQILPNGEVVLKGKKGDLGGQSTIRVDVDSFYDSMTRDANGNPIFNQSKFRSQTQNINERRNILYHGGDTTNDVAPVPVAETEESGEESVPEAITEAPVPTGEADYRDGTYTILIDGKPVEVEVYSQDNPSDTVIYSYVDENGNERIGRTTIEGFGRAIQEAQGIQPTEAEEDTEFPAVPDNVPEVVNVTESTQAPQEVPVTPETINWDALFDNDPEAYFSELQNRYGEKTEKMLNAVIAATQKKLDALNKANPDTQEEIFANEEQKDRLQAKIDALKGMIARLAPAENVDAEPVAEQAESETTTEPVVATTEETAPVTPETSEAAQETTANGFIIVDKVITNPEVIEMPNTPNGDANRIFVGEYNGKWTYGAEALMDNGSWGKTPEMRIENARYNTREEAIAGAISFLENQWKAKHKNAGSTALETFIQYVRDNYLVKPSEAEVAPAAEPAKPVAPTPVDDPIREAQKREKSLATQLRRVGIPHEQKQDMAFNAGKAVADFFATREEYEAYAENATDFKEYNADFERGVEASFANRPQITSVSQDNSVPLESEQTPTTNEEQGTVPAEQTGGPGTSSGDRGSDNTRGEEGDSEATEEPPVRESGSGAEESLEDRYPARKGDVTPKMLQETFGFGSVSSALEQSILNSTYDIMMEMSKMLGISPTSMSHGGALTLDKMPDSAPAYIDASYGRNGKYGTPVTRSYIRIRFGRNLSGIAHEWWHSLDHFLKYYNSGSGNELASEIGVDSFDGRKEVIKAIKAVLRAIKNSGHVARVEGMPLSTADKKYFKSRKEIIARAFEEYIIGKFAAAGIEIDGVSKDNHWAQPTAEEMSVITPAFDKLFKILLEKEGKKEGTTMLYKIGEYADERLEDISEEAVQLADDTVALMTDEAGIETVAVPDEQIDEMSEAAGVDANFMIAPDKPVFISNAAIAVEAIKQDKATPEQWLKMIEKNGGLKAGEDKWMGLSEWLKASDKKTLTKQEVLDYIHENMIQIEEQHYLEDIRIEAEELKQVDAMDDEFEALKKEAEANGENHIDAAEIAYQLMAEKYGDDFTFGFGVDNGHLYVSNLEAAASITGIQPRPERYINETRLNYTTSGLENPREIALVVPTIDSWGEEDEIHFGDAGNGRAVAWIRFGETETPVEDANYTRLQEIYDRLNELEMKVSSSTGITMEEYEERASLRRERDELQEIKPKTRKVLVIDEIQSKRHQAGREKGYKSDFDFYKKEKESIDRLDAMYERRGELIREKVNNEEQELAEIARLDIALDEVANVRDYDALTAEKDAIIQKRLDRLKELNELNSEINKLEDELAHLKVRYDYDYSVAIPDAPFDKNWQDVAMKRMLRYAAENGYDAVAWTKGEQQAERYGIGKVVSSVGYRRTEDGKRVRVNMRGGESLLFDVDILGKVTEVYRGGGVVTNGMALSEIVGADLAKQIGNYEGEVDERGDYNIKSEDFRIGGEGMKGFYDKILPAFVNKYGKKWGIKVEDINLPLVEQAGRVMHSVPVTQEMKDSVMEGQPMFMKKPNGKIYGWTDGKKIYLTRHGFNPNTRIHEYTHLWANAMMQKNPKGWQSVKDLLRGTPVWNEVMNDANYSSIHNNEDMVASEVLSRISGTKNAAKLERMAQQMIDDAKGTMRKLEARGLVQRIKDALNEFWSWVGTELFGIEKFESVEQVTDRVLWDLMNKTALDSSENSISLQNNENTEGTYTTGDAVSNNVSGLHGQELSERQGVRGVPSNNNAKFEPISERVGESEQQRKVREQRFISEVSQFTPSEQVSLYNFLRDHIALCSGELKYRSDKFIAKLRDNGNDSLANFLYNYIEDELIYRDTTSSIAAKKHGFEIGVEKDIREIENIFYGKNQDTYNTKIFDRALALAEKFGVTVSFVTRMPNGEYLDLGGWYTPYTNSISIDASYLESSREEDLCHTIVHELIHSVVSRAASIKSGRAVNKNHQFIDPKSLPKHVEDGLNDLEKVYEEIKKDYTFDNEYGREDYEEMLSEISNSDFRDLLKAKNLWKRVIKGISKIISDFKRGYKKSDALSEIEVALDKVLSSAERGELDNLYSEYLVHLDQKYTLADLQNYYYPLGSSYNDILYRREDIQNAAVNYLAGDARDFAIENAVNEEAAKLGVTVTYKTRSEMPKGHENDKGYYNTKTGEIVICTENAASIADAIQTILHEAVAHKGLRQLMGDKFNEFINRVYDSLDAETKAKVDELAEKHYNGNKEVAMEEYMATLAETEDFSKNTVWDKIKSIFENIINTILGRNDIKIGDNELRYILRASYANMVNPRNMETIKGWAQDQMMREEYKINEASPEIMYRTGIDPTQVSRESAKAVYDKVVRDGWQEFQREFQDAYQPVRIAIEAIQQETGNIPIEDYENYLLIQNQSSSRSRVEIDEFARRYYSPIIKQVNAIIDMMLESRGLDKHDEKLRADAYAKIRQYMIAKHGLERNEYYQTHRMRKLTAAEKKKAIKEAQDVYDDMVNQINSDTTLTDAERENQLRNASDEFNAARIDIETREVPWIRDYSGLTSLFGLKPEQFKKAEAEAQRVVDQFESEFGGAADALWDRINAATNKTLRHSYECGLLSRAQYEEIKSMFKFYIPLRGFDETTAEDVYAYARFEGNRFNPAVYSAGGRTSLADDPIAIIMNMAESEIAQGNKNRAKIALYNYLINRPITDENGEQHQNSLMQIESVWYIKNIDEDGNEFYTIASPNHERGETTAEFEERMKALEAEDKAYKSKKGKVDIGKRFQKPMNRNAHYVYLKVNGVEKAIYINGDPKAADAINGTYRPKPIYEKGSWRPKSEKVNKVIEFAEENLMMSNINRLLSSTFTNYSLEFTARNYFRDMIYSHINIDVRESDPAYRKKFRQNWRHNNIKTMLQMLKAYRAGEFDGRQLTEDEAAFVEFMQNGGQTGYTVINSVENHKKDLERAIKNMQKGIERGGVKDSTIFKYTLGAVEMLNEASELVTRFAAFKTSRDMGRDVVRSISDAKEITVNFNTKGAQDRKGVMGIMAAYFGWSKFFFNASVQGVQNIKAMAEANKLKFCTTVGGVAAFGFVMPIIASAIAEAMGGDDDEYWNIPEYERQNNFCIPIGGGKYAKIPLPIGFREIYAMGDMVAAMAFNKMSTRDVWQVGTDMANKIASIVLPINPLESSVNGLSIWHTIAYTAAPSSTQFIIQNLSNVDWKGAPLQKEYTYNENDPQWMKAFASNPDWMVGLSKWCYEHWNLDGDYNGWNWSPEKLDNTLSNLFGGIYSLVKKTGRSISMIWNEENRNLSNIPLSGVVLGSGIDKDDRFVNDVYFEEKDFYDSQLGDITRMAEKFGYDLDDIFEKEKGKHHPKIMEIYKNKHFDFMQEWYKGNKELEEINNEIKKLEKKINSKDNPSEFLLHKLAKKKAELASERRDFVNDMLELD